MADKQDIQRCIQTCTGVASELRSTANGVTDSGIRDMLTQGTHHVEQCIRQCESASMLL